MSETTAELEYNPNVLTHSFRALLVGPSQSGKSELIKYILLHDTIKPAPEQIVYFYGIPLSSHAKLAEEVKQFRGIDIEFRHGIDSLRPEEWTGERRVLVIFDDLFTVCSADDRISACWYYVSSHQNCSFIMSMNPFYIQSIIYQPFFFLKNSAMNTLFPKAKHSKLIGRLTTSSN